jgi:hypothetical protein
MILKICETCGKVFETQLRKGRGKYCSKECYYNKNGGRILKVCPVCGKSFSVKASRHDKAKYCSVECRNNRNGELITKICKTCGKSFTVQPCNKDKIYCSRECHHNSAPRIIKVCEICGCEFEVINSYKDARFCSIKCQGIWQSRERTGENGANWKGHTIEIKCKYCGKIIYTTLCYEGHKFFCSKICVSKWMSENKSGKNHSQYKNKILKICKNCGLIFKVHEYNINRKFCSIPCFHEYINTYPKTIEEKIRRTCARRNISTENFDGIIHNTWRDWNNVIYLNNWFEGCHRHHITKTIVACIPPELHKHIWHNLHTGQGMYEINTLIFQYLDGYYK